MEDALVKRKADAASLWAFIATEFHGKTVSDKPWSYLLVPEDALRDNTTVKGLQASFTRIADADLRARYDLANV